MNRYGADLRESNLKGPLASLDILYNTMPKTEGCEKCSEINGESDKDWCCKRQSPSMYYVEFLKILKKDFLTWNKEKKCSAILRAIKNYLDNSLSKGCIFYNNGCLVYNNRPFQCRLYGVVPKESWEKRWETLKSIQKDSFNAEPQCPLVSSKTPVTTQNEEKWIDHITDCEIRIGVSKSIINKHDDAGGSYRTFHDHLLLELFPEQFLVALSQIRLLSPTSEDIDHTISLIDLDKIL